MKKLLLTAALFAIPAVAFAQSARDVQNLGRTFINLINEVAVPIIFALAFLVFIWGVFNYFIVGGGDEEKREKGRDLMIWGLLGFFVMVSVWGLVNLLVNTVDFDDTTAPDYPEAPLTNQ